MEQRVPALPALVSTGVFVAMLETLAQMVVGAFPMSKVA